MAISINLQKDILNELDEIAKSRESSRSSVIRIAIKKFIEGFENGD